MSLINFSSQEKLDKYNSSTDQNRELFCVGQDYAAEDEHGNIIAFMSAAQARCFRTNETIISFRWKNINPDKKAKPIYAIDESSIEVIPSDKLRILVLPEGVTSIYGLEEEAYYKLFKTNLVPCSQAFENKVILGTTPKAAHLAIFRKFKTLYLKNQEEKAKKEAAHGVLPDDDDSSSSVSEEQDSTPASSSVSSDDRVATAKKILRRNKSIRELVESISVDGNVADSDLDELSRIFGVSVDEIKTIAGLNS